MATKKFTKKMKCINIQQAIGRSSVSFAQDIAQTDKGATARNVVSFNFSDPADAAGFEAGKEYTITVE